jgi:antitoxin VapB
MEVRRFGRCYILVHIIGGYMAKGDRAETAGLAKRAKVFWTGRSQAVRLPKEFRFEDEEVAIHREGDRVILEPVRRRRSWPRGYWERMRELAADFEFPGVEPLPGGPRRPGLGDW